MLKSRQMGATIPKAMGARMDRGSIAAGVEFKFVPTLMADGQTEDAASPLKSFEGYAAIFNNVDLGGDMMEPGAFAKSLSQRFASGRASPPLYYNHDVSKGSVGRLSHLEEDKAGLFVKGVINTEIPEGAAVYSRAKNGQIGGFSFGYVVPPGGYRRGAGKMGEPRRFLKQVDLREVSLVDDPMNPAAQMTFLKSQSGLFIPEVDFRELEDALREEVKLSRNDAKHVVAVFKKHIRRDDGFAEGNEGLREEAPQVPQVAVEYLRERMSAFAKSLTSQG